MESDFPDAEAVFMALLQPVARSVQTLPDEITGPMFRVLRIGGPDDGVTDNPLMSVEAFDTTYAGAKAIAEEGRQVILAAGCSAVTVSGFPKPVLIDATRTATAPTELPYANPELRRKPASYQAWLRRQY